MTLWGLGNGSNALSDSLWPDGQRAHQFLINIKNVTFGGVSTGLPIDYDIEYLSVPGAAGVNSDVITSSNIDCPGAINTYPFAINSMSAGTFMNASGQTGTIVGIYQDGSTFLTHAYQYSGGLCTIIDYPGAVVTWATGINNAGQVVGYWEDSSALYHGFTLSGGKFKSINYPGYNNTYLDSINDAGQILGHAYQGGVGTKDFFYYGSTFYHADFAATINGEAVIAGTSTSGGVYMTSRKLWFRRRGSEVPFRLISVLAIPLT